MQFNRQKVETKNGDTVAMIYLENLESNGICIKIGVIRAHIVLDQKPVLIHVYDYYDTCKFAFKIFNCYVCFATFPQCFSPLYKLAKNWNLRFFEFYGEIHQS